MDNITIEWMQMTEDGKVSLGNWQPIRTNVLNNPQYITIAMNECKRMFSGNVRIRAVDSNGRLVDMLMN